MVFKRIKREITRIFKEITGFPHMASFIMCFSSRPDISIHTEEKYNFKW